MFHIGQRIICVDDRFVGENRVFDRTFTVRCPNLPVKSRVYTVRGFVPLEAVSKLVVSEPYGAESAASPLHSCQAIFRARRLSR